MNSWFLLCAIASLVSGAASIRANFTRKPNESKKGRFFTHGLATPDQCSLLYSVADNESAHLNYGKYTPDFGVEAFHSAREEYREYPGMNHSLDVFEIFIANDA